MVICLEEKHIVLKKDKICTGCKEVVLIEDFCKCKKSADGHQSRCKKCTRDSSKKWAIDNKERIKELNRRLYESKKDFIKKQNKERYNSDLKRSRESKRISMQKIRANFSEEKKQAVREYKKKYNEEHKQERSLYKKDYNPKTKEQRSEYKKKYMKQKPWIFKNLKAKRRAVIKLRSISIIDGAKIKEIYKQCPEGMQVDHIIPLNGKNVSGLHVSWNLQYLTPLENQQKNNKLILESEAA